MSQIEKNKTDDDREKDKAENKYLKESVAIDAHL